MGRRAIHLHEFRRHGGLDGTGGDQERTLQREGRHLVLRGLPLGTPQLWSAIQGEVIHTFTIFHLFSLPFHQKYWAFQNEVCSSCRQILKNPIVKNVNNPAMMSIVFQVSIQFKTFNFVNNSFNNLYRMLIAQLSSSGSDRILFSSPSHGPALRGTNCWSNSAGPQSQGTDPPSKTSSYTWI